MEQTDFQILDSDNPHKRYEINLNKRGSLTVFVVPCTGNIEL